MGAGFGMMFVGLAEALGAPEEEGTPTVLKVGYNVVIVGLATWTVGKIGQIISGVITERAFAHLHDAIDYFNAEPAK